MTSAEALTLLRWVPLHARLAGHRCCLVQDALKGEISEHLDVFNSTISQQHDYNTRNGYLPKVSRPRAEWARNKTYFKVINDSWGLTAKRAQEIDVEDYCPENDFSTQIEFFEFLVLNDFNHELLSFIFYETFNFS